MEKVMEAKGARPEAFDFFILYTALMTVQDKKIRDECVLAGKAPAPARPVLSIEHDDDVYGEAISNPKPLRVEERQL